MTTKEKRAEKLQEELEAEWSRMHHNASISGYFPNLKNEYENDLFWSVLGDEVSFWIDDLQETIAEKFGETLKFYSYGRMGATIAPDKYMSHVGGNSFGGLNYYVNEDDLEDAERVLKMFQYINQYWRDTAKSIPEWWQEMKETNDYQKDIDEHEGKTAVMRKVWIPKDK